MVAKEVLDIMAQKRKLSLAKITDFLQASLSATEHEISKEQVGPASPKHTKHRNHYDLNWDEEFPWLRYVPEDEGDGSSMLCSICGKHKESSKRMVWITIPCNLFLKDELCEHG